MGLEWLLNPGVPSLLPAPGRSVVELWPEDVTCTCSPDDELGRVGATCFRPEFYQTEAEVLRAWKTRHDAGWKFWAIHLRGRHVKAVHMPDRCTCQRCHPDYHGPGRCLCHWPQPRVHARGRCFCTWHDHFGY